jgi:aminoglycoside phosphotransferase family enzyme
VRNVAPAKLSRPSARREIPVEEKVAFLRDPAAYPEAPSTVVVRETHMSWVFLTPERAFKLKKPVRYAFLDFSTLEAREADCREELRLNRRLAGDTYLSVSPLTRSPDGRLAIAGQGDVVDWLVVMRRLPEARMLETMLAKRAVDEQQIDRLGDVLASFYQRAEHPLLTPSGYHQGFTREQAENRKVLVRRRFAVDHGRVPLVLDRLDAALNEDRALIEQRAAAGRIVDGHGDLRPEHVCLTDPIVIFDCLEFNRELRVVDPVDELAFLGMECALHGAPWIGPKLIAQVTRRLGDEVPSRLVRIYEAFRAVLRARLALAHLLDPTPREPAKWEPLASRYLALAEQALEHRTQK